MPIYRTSSDKDAKQFNVKPEKLDKFLAEYPNAVLVEETPPTENFQNGDAETDASVTPETSQASNGDSTSGDGSSESSKSRAKKYSYNPERRTVVQDNTGVKRNSYIPQKKKEPVEEITSKIQTFNAPYKELLEQEKAKQLPSKNISFVSSIKGKKYDKKTGTYVEGKDYEELFLQKEESAVDALNLIYEGSNLNFEEDNFNVVTEEEYGVPGPDSKNLYSQVSNMLDVAKVSIPGVEETIQLQLKTDNPDIVALNLKRLEDYTEKYKEFLYAPRINESAARKLEFWEANNVKIKENTSVASKNFLENPDLFTPKSITKRVVSSAGGGTVASSEFTVIETPYQGQLQATEEAICRQYPEIKVDELSDATERTVRNTLYQKAVNDIKYAAREQAVKDGVLTEAELFVGGYLIKNEKAKEYNTATKKVEIALENRKETNNVIAILNSENYTDENQQAVLRWGAKNDVFIDPNSKVVTLKNGQQVTESFIETANQLEISMIANKMVIEQLSREQNLAIGEIDDANLSLEASAKNYNQAEKALANIAYGGLDIAMGATFLLGSVPMLLADEESQDSWNKFGAEYSLASQELRGKFVRDVQFKDAFGSASNFGTFAMQEISNQIPILAAMYLSGGTLAPYVIGASTAGGKMMDMQAEIATGTADYSATEVWLKSLGYGAAEGIFAGLTTVPILKRANQTWINAGKEQLLDKQAIEFFKSYSKRGIVYEALLESGGEALTTGSQNLIDGKPFTENMDHAGFSGFGFGLVFAGVPFLKGMYNSQFTSFEKLAEARALQKEIDVLGRQFELAKTKEDRVRITEMIAEKSVNLADAIKKQEALINNNLTEGGATRVIAMINRMADLQNKAQDVQNSNLSDFVKKQRIADLRKKFDKLAAIKNYAVSAPSMLKNDTEFAAFEATDKEAYDAYIEKATQQLTDERGGKDPSKSDAKDRAYDLYFGDQVRAENNKQQTGDGSFLDEGFISFETKEDANAYIDGRTDLSEKTKAELKEGINEGNDGAAVKADGDIKALTIAVVENQVLNQRKFTRTHEVGHQAFWQIFSNSDNDAVFKNISDQLLKTLKNTDSKVYEELMDDSVRDKNNEVDPAEVISKFLEFVAEGKITNAQKAKGISGLMGAMIQKSFGGEYNFDFRGEQDMFNFVVGVGKKISSGELTMADIVAARENKTVQAKNNLPVEKKDDKKEGVTKADSKARKLTEAEEDRMEAIDQEISQIEDDLNNNYIDLDTHDRLIAKLEEEYESIENPPKVEAKPKPRPKAKAQSKSDIDAPQASKKDEQKLSDVTAKSKKKLDAVGNNPEGFDANDPVIYETLDGMIRSKVKAFKTAGNNIVNLTNLPGFEMDNMVSETIASLIPYIKKFDPAKNDSLFGYTMAQLSNRMRGALKTGRVTENAFTEDVTAAKNITAEESQAPVKEKPKYRKFTEAGTVSTEVIDAIRTKLKTVLRTLKSRMDAAVSNNRTITPLIAEIQYEMGRQADIDLKKAMGGKKDLKLRKFLLKGKKAILENLTTTFLMGKDGQGGFPQAIQKKIDGKWVSYPAWVGQKIDRETTSTDNAGRTSGAELVRRVPNVNRVVTDQEFLSQILNETGNPIRGRKEALAKAMAEEISFEIFSADLANPASDISEAFETNQERQGAILADNFVQEIGKDIDRGNIKFSKIRFINSGFAPLDSARKASQAYLTKEFPEELYNGQLDSYEDIQALRNEKPEFDELMNTLEDAFTRYLNVADTKALKDKAVKFKAAGNMTLTGFINSMISLSKPNIEASLGLEKGTVVIGNPSDALLRSLDYSLGNMLKADIAKYGAEEAIKIFIRTHQPGMASGKGRSVFGNNQGFFDFMKKLGEMKGNQSIKDAIKKSGLKIISYGSGKTLVTNKGKITSPIKQEAAAPDLTGLIKGTDLSVDFKGRKKLEDNSKKTYNNLLETLKEGLADGSVQPLAAAAILKSMATSMRSPAKTLATLKFFYRGDAKIAEDFTFEHGTPVQALLVASAFYINGGGISKTVIDSIIEKSHITILPTKIANAVDALYKSKFPLGSDALSLDNPGFARYFNELVQQVDARFTKDSLINLQDLQNIQKEVADAIVGWSKSSFKNFNAKDYTNAVNGQQAINNTASIKFSQTPKGISVFDFDDTLARTKSNVLYVMPDGTKGKLNAAQFAAKSETMLEQGAEFDFSEFSKVMKGELGPLFSEAQKKEGKYTNKDIFVLTARPANSAAAIHEFLKSEGLNIPIENITGLGNGSPQAKADWMVGKIAEGYNDFYFADDHMGNVKAVGKALKGKGVKGQTELSIVDFKNQPKAVRDILNTFDVKGPTQRSRVKFSSGLNKGINDMLERASDIKSRKRLTRVEGEILGKNKGRWKYWMPSSLEDFRGLTEYTFAGKGRQGDADQKFFQDALVKPYWRAINEIDIVKQSLKNGFAALNKQYKPVLKKLGKRVPGMAYTHDQALRVYLWNKAGYEIPGLTRKQERELVRFVQGDAELMAYANGALQVAQKKEWSKPSEYWAVQTILSDINNFTEKTGRKEYLKEFIDNADLIFSENNLNKIEAIYGKAHREAIEDILYRMKNGVNRAASMKSNEQKWNNWLNNSIGAIMFMNRRSALLQLLSTVNFINWSDNNPMKAAAAFANQKQYWADFAMIFNSPKLKQRRSGLKTDVNAAELASAVTGATDKATAALNYLLKIGFTPTQMVDSFAIAAGGATFYRNRVNTYLNEKGADGKPKYTQKQAEDKAFKDFIPISDETQQSGDPALISSDQSSSLGRIVLNFMNTPIQLNRTIKKSAQDLYNRRRIPGQTQAQSDFTNFSKIIYYGTIQNAIFSALQAAMFALIPGFNDDEDEEGNLTMEEKTEKKLFAVINSMVDTTLKGGFGLPGAVVSILKNAIIEYQKQKNRGFLADDSKTLIALLNISPAVGSKARKIVNFAKGERFDKEVISERGWDVTIDGRFNLSPRWNSAGNLVEGLTNIPMARAVDEVNSITEALDSRNTAWQRIALALGWKTWNVGAKNEENDLLEIKIKSENKERKEEERKEKRKKEKLLKEMQEKDRRSKMSQDDRDLEDFIKKEKRRIKSKNTRAKTKKKKDSIADIENAKFRAALAKKRKEKANKNK